MSQIYSDPARESEPHALPNVETFWLDAAFCPELNELITTDEDIERHECESIEHESRSGWYWQACFPGCLPDGDPIGPFDTEQEAIADAQDC